MHLKKHLVLHELRQLVSGSQTEAQQPHIIRCLAENILPESSLVLAPVSVEKLRRIRGDKMMPIYQLLSK